MLLTREICGRSPRNNSNISMPNKKDCDNINHMTGAVKNMINEYESVWNKILNDFLGYLTSKENAEVVSRCTNLC